MAVAILGNDTWVANSRDNTVSCFGPDGTLLNTVPVGREPWAVEPDNRGVWVANAGDGTLTRVSKEGDVLLTVEVAGRPATLQFAGNLMWVALIDAAAASAVGMDGSVVGTYGVGRSPADLAFDGTRIWVANAAEKTRHGADTGRQACRTTLSGTRQWRSFFLTIMGRGTSGSPTWGTTP